MTIHRTVLVSEDDPVFRQVIEFSAKVVANQIDGTLARLANRKARRCSKLEVSAVGLIASHRRDLLG